MDKLEKNCDKYCRTCMKDLDSQQFNILELSHLSLWLKMWASLEVENDDPLPKYLCEQCYIKIEDFHEFSKMCIKSAKKYYEILKKSNQIKSEQDIKPNVPKEDDKKVNEQEIESEIIFPLNNVSLVEIKNEPDNILESENESISQDNLDDIDYTESMRKSRKYICETCGKKYMNKDRYEACLKKHQGIKPWSCSECDKTYTKRSSLQNHIKGWHKEKPKIFNCPIKNCNKSYKLKESVQNHCKLNHKVDYDLEGTEQQKPTKDNLQGRHNDETVEKNNKSDVEENTIDKNNSEEHESDNENEDNKKYKVNNKNITSKSRYSKKNIFKCGICHKGFIKKELYEACVKKHQGLKPWVCKICGKEYRKSTSLRYHMNSEHDENPIMHPCPFEGCSKSYKSKETTQKHYRLIHLNQYRPITDRKYMCQECGKCFKLNNQLTQHIYTHTGEFPFKCERCPKSFGTRYLLDVHYRRHDGIKNFVCTICGMKKATRKELKTHMNYHSREIVHKCKYCPYNSCNHGNVARHERVVHLGERSFKCRYCDNSFGKAETLKHHEMIHTGEKPHECKECGRRFIQRTALKTHMKCHLKGTIKPLSVTTSKQKSNNNLLNNSEIKIKKN